MTASPLWNSVIDSGSGHPPPDPEALTAKLLETARLLSAGGSGEPVPLLEGFSRLMRQAQVLAPALAAGAPQDESCAELRSFYGIARQLWEYPEAVELVIDRSSPGALRALQNSFPQCSRQILGHVRAYGWIPLRNRPEPMTAKHVIQRLQKVFLRFKPADIEPVAGSPTEDGPSPGLNIDLLFKTEYLAGDFLARIATALHCPADHLRFCSHQQITAALEGASDLELDQIALKIKQAPAALGGQSVSLGRAAGRARIIGRAAQGAGLEIGDIVVTGLSSPDHGGAASIFPTRTEAAVDIHRAGGLLIDDGGLLSHAAMISREHGIPCIVGTERGTAELCDGQYIEVDATRGQGRVSLF